MDLVLGVLLTLVVLEAARRATGWAIPIFVVLMFLYVFIGPYLSGTWQHPGFSLKHVLGSIYYSPLGIYGGITGASATFIAMFLVFGAMLGATGGGQTFMDLALLIAGRFRGGPAKVAVGASAMFGSISGSSVANVSVTGNYTIPLMVRLGYSKNFAGGVEAMASTGGGFTPPIMGISAFIMAEFTGIPYIHIIAYALIPCLLFYAGIIAGIHFEALRLDLPSMPPEEIPPRHTVLKFSRLLPLFAPLAILLWFLYQGSSLAKAGFYASFTLIVMFLLAGVFLKQTKERLVQVAQALAEGGRSAATIVPILVAVNIFTNLLGMTGVAPKISGLIVQIGGDHLWGALLVAAIVPFVLGTALPTSATYILSVAIIAPAIMKLNADLVAVHMFLIYWATLAAVTPPTCTGCIIAANIGGGNWLKVATSGMRLGITAFLIPFFFVLEPALVGRSDIGSILLHTLTGVTGAILMAAGFFGFFLHKLGPAQRVIFVCAGLLLLYPSSYLFLVGLLLAGATTAWCAVTANRLAHNS